MKISKFLLSITFCFLFLVLFYQPCTLAEEKPSIPSKYGSELSKEERRLRVRWTKERVNEVVNSLKTGKGFPEFVKKTSLSEKDIKTIAMYKLRQSDIKNYDLREIPLNDQDLKNVVLTFTHLEGAILTRANLQGAVLMRANLQGAFLLESNLQGAYFYLANLQGAKASHANLQGADLSFANLTGFDSAGLNMQGVHLTGAEMKGAYLEAVNLKGADLAGVNLEGAYLSGANLEGANVTRANLKGAYLSGANLEGANLEKTNLQGMELFHARFGSTYLWLANLGEAKNIRYVVWGGKPSYRITEHSMESLKSDRVPQDVLNKLGSIRNEEFIGEANFIDALTRTIGKEKTEQYKFSFLNYALAGLQSHSFYIGEEKAMNFHEDFQNAEITYRDLKTIYQKESLDDVAKEFNFRENEVKTKSSSLPMRIFRLFFLKWTYGYGSRPFWLFRYSLAVIGIFTLVFALLTLLPKTKSGIYVVRSESDSRGGILSFRKGLIFLECLYFSLLSFTTFGYGALQPRQWLEFFRLEPIQYKPIGWTRIFVGLEAAIGIYLLALLAIVLFGR